ncbi:hypothetical protein D018_0867A, partial [Vibrio parahaemolyticus VP2007-007]
MPIGQL